MPKRRKKARINISRWATLLTVTHISTDNILAGVAFALSFLSATHCSWAAQPGIAIETHVDEFPLPGKSQWRPLLCFPSDI